MTRIRSIAFLVAVLVVALVLGRYVRRDAPALEPPF